MPLIGARPSRMTPKQRAFGLAQSLSVISAPGPIQVASFSPSSSFHCPRRKRFRRRMGYSFLSAITPFVNLSKAAVGPSVTYAQSIQLVSLS